MTVALGVVPAVAATPLALLGRSVLVAGLLSAAMIPLVWKPARPLRTYAGMLLLLTLLAVLFWNAVPTWLAAQAWFPDPAGYAAAFLVQSPKLVAALVMMTVLSLLSYPRQELFLSSGGHGKWWIGAGVVAVLAIGVAIVVYAQLTTVEVSGAVGGVRYLPLALVLAGMNSFAEEVLYRGVLLAPLLRHVNPTHAVGMTAVLFGMAHYQGTPSGLPGMALTFLAGWVFGLAMVETRSLLLPWFLHFVPDAVIYVTSALHD
jgi:membrane protease YdiL (CAAX protease family)